ncbi:hypothetical protein DPMN_156656, partial [Dreissena polymorpha]
HHPNRVVEFVYYNSSRSWNEARNICIEIGGDPNMFQDERDVHIVTNMFSKHNNTVHHNYWVGLCDGLDNKPVWAGMCEEANAVYDFRNYACVIYNSYGSSQDILYMAKQCLKVSVNLTLPLWTGNLGNTSSEPNSDCSA